MLMKMLALWLRRLASGSLDPLTLKSLTNEILRIPYPQRLHIQTLKGYFWRDKLAGAAAENLHPFGIKDWGLPAY